MYTSSGMKEMSRQKQSLFSLFPQMRRAGSTSQIRGTVTSEVDGWMPTNMLVPGGGVEPPRGCPRRILSLFFATLQCVAFSCKVPHKYFGMNVLHQRPSLQSVAPKCTKVGNEQPSKRPLKTASTMSASAEICHQLRIDYACSRFNHSSDRRSSLIYAASFILALSAFT